MRKALSVLCLILSGCASYAPEILTPITNLNDFYQQCKNSQTISLDNRSLSLSDRYYCLGFVQAAAETTIYWRKQMRDISPQCHVTVSDFYYELILSIETEWFNEKNSVPEVFRKLSYAFSPRIQRANGLIEMNKSQLKSKQQYLKQEDLDIYYGR